MNPGDYRRDYAAYHSAVERERFKLHAGLASHADTHAVEERYADLWTRDSIEDLRRAREDTPAEFETERAGLLALEGAARVRNVEDSAREVSEELQRCCASSRVEWDGAKVSAGEARELLADERDGERRRELARRRLDALRACDDLRAARLDALDAATRSQGCAGRRALYESFAGVDLGELAARAGAFLERSESIFMSRLARWAALELPEGAGRGLSHPDEFFFVRGARFDAYFPARDFRAVYEETLAGLGVRIASRKNLRIDDAPRPSKGARTVCFAVAPPEDVRLIVGARASGLDIYREGFREGGRAQMYAWASRETAARYPEFVRAPDRATEGGYGFLLAGLLSESDWLTARRGMRASRAEEFASFVALLELHDARRDCALLKHALALDGEGRVRSEQTAEEYVALLSGATGFRHQAATALADADEFFESATRLRARLFAVAFGEHLRLRHGRRWFETRAAGEELIDVWNTASRYAVEELARLVWGGELSFDLLADVLLASVEGGV